MTRRVTPRRLPWGADFSSMIDSMLRIHNAMVVWYQAQLTAAMALVPLAVVHATVLSALRLS